MNSPEQIRRLTSPFTQTRHFFKLIFLLLCMLGGMAMVAQASAIEGKVYDRNNNEPLVEAAISLVNTSYAVASDVNGNYLLKGIPAGHYTIIVRYIGYNTYQKEIDVKENQTLKMDIGLSENTHQMKSIAIFAKMDKSTESSSRLTEKNADNEENVIGSNSMISSPDISVANVVQRLSGVTLQKSAGSGESYSIIRGMEPRYNNTLLDGIKIPSPNNKSRFVSLNIIPSDLLRRIVVSKTLLPEMEGDATGGTVDLITKDAPEKALLRVHVSGGYNQILIDRKYISFNQSVIQQKSPIQTHGTNYTAKPGDFTRANLDFQPKTAVPNATAGVTWGRRFMHNKLGVLIGDEFQNGYHGTNGLYYSIAPKPYSNNQYLQQDVTGRTISSQQLNNGINAHLDYEINTKNKLNLDNVFIYSYFAQARTSIDTVLYADDQRTGPGTGYVTYTDRSLTQKQHIENLKLSGTHALTNRLLVTWSGVMAIAGQNQPDRADFTNIYDVRLGGLATPQQFHGGDRLWQHNNDHDYTGKADVTYKMLLAGQDLELKAGGLYRRKTRYNQQDLYILQRTAGANGIAETFQSIYTVNWLVYNPLGTAEYDNSNYDASENIGAGYVQAKFIINKLQVIGGARVENTQEAFHTRPFRNDLPTTANDTYTDILPSIHFRYNLSVRQDVRLSYYKSIARPEYYELVPYTQPGLYYDEKGNPNLKHTKADNFDFRYELFPNPQDQVMAGVFYKKITDPIEYALTSLALGRSGQLVYTPTNFGTAHNYGFELQFTKYIGSFGVTGNYTYTHSSIRSTKIYNNNNTTKIVKEDRPLQGQSDNVANLSLMYNERPLGLFGQLDFQYIGKTLNKVTEFYQADYYQKPQLSLAASVDKRFGAHFTLFGKFDNLLNTPSVLNTNHGLLVGRNTYGSSYSIGIRFSN